MKIKCLIIDDEPLAREGIEEYVKELTFLDLRAVCEDPVQAANIIQQQNIDLIFLDIHMPKMSGLDFLRTLHQFPMVIIITAYPSYALEGFALDVLDYLVKPVSPDRFIKACNKARDYFRLKQGGTEGEPKKENYFFIKSENRYEKVNLDDVLFIEGMQNYVTIHTLSNRFITHLTMKAMEESLPQDRFMRVQKSFIISLSKVDAVDGNELVIGDKKISISRERKDEVMARLMGGKLIRR